MEDIKIFYNLEAERAILGSMILNKDEINKGFEYKLDIEDFYLAKNQVIYKILVDLNKKGEAVDLVCLWSEIQQKDKTITDSIDFKYLTDICESVSSLSFTENYIKKIKGLSLKRKLLEMSNFTKELVYSDLEIDDMLNQLEENVIALRQERSTDDLDLIKETVLEEADKIKELTLNPTLLLEHNKDIVSTGFSELDQLLQGGFDPKSGQLVILAARAAMGKTSAVLNIALNVAKKYKKPVAFFSMEMTKNDLVKRIISSEYQLSTYQLQAGGLPKNDLDRFTRITNELANVPIFCYDKGSLSPAKIKALCNKLKIKYKELGAVIIDYLQLMEPDSMQGNREQEIAKISRSLKNMAMTLKVPVIALSQLSRNVEQRQNKRPQLSDLRESGCVTGDTLIYNCDTKTMVTIKEMVDKVFKTKCINHHGEHELMESTALNVFYSGNKEVFKVTTSSGKQVKASANHPFLTPSGWSRLDKLYITCPVAVVHDNQIIYEEIISIDKLGYEDVYDMTIQTHHNFIGNDFVLHNSIEQDADIVMFIYRDEYYNPNSEKKRIAEMIVAKHRNGPVDTVELYFDPSIVKFSDLEKM